MKRMTMALVAVTLAILIGGPVRANDEQIAKTIIQRLQQQKQSAQLQGFNIGVQVEEGTVTMMGTVAQTDHALMALDIARRVPGVKLVVNDLFVQPAGAAQGTLPGPSPVAAEQQPVMKSIAVSAPTSAPMPGLQPSWGAAQPVPTIQPVTAEMQIPQIGGNNAGFIAPPAVGTSAPQGQLMAQHPVAAQGPVPQAMPVRATNQMPLAFAASSNLPAQRAAFAGAPEYQAAPAQYGASGYGGEPVPMNMGGGGMARASYDNPQMPGYAWPSYAAYPNYSAVTYPHQYSPTAWPYIGPFYPYPQVPLGWRKVTLEWDDGWWFLDFNSK
jgi:hypothetical protein